ncbi:MAG: hypothetical protein WCX95_04805 [Candidatus Gracilibacteria bacterium]
MNQPNELNIKLSRIPLFLLFVTGAFFVLAGLDITFFHRVLDFQIAADKKLYFYLFDFFMIGCGGLITLQMLWYLISPATMLKADNEGIWFGCGLRYNLFNIPWKYVENIGGGIDKISLIANQKLIAGLQIQFKKSDEIPMGKATSIGLSYFNYCLTLNIFYMNNKNIKGIVEKLNGIRKI